MTRDLLASLGPELYAAYAVALADRAATGRWPEAPRINQVAMRHACCPWALLALTRGELPALDHERKLTGDLVRLNAPAAEYVLAPTPEALTVLHVLALEVGVRVVDPWAREVPRNRLRHWADDWSALVHRSPFPEYGRRCSVAPYSINPPNLHLGVEEH